ncbi:hypothetical protein M0805_005893 [Coniferiporia weirii]|nr:hypothetical protein M0805_005893 [Coniferiporia weirii]
MAPRPMKRGGSFRGAKNVSRPTSRKDNAAGFAKRRARSAKAAADADVYDYQPGKSKRANVALMLDEDETRGAGYSDDEEEGDEEGGRAGRKPRLIGEGEEDERIGSDEDEEIDSDGAFEESDEERFAEFNFKKGPVKSRKAPLKKVGKSVHFAEVDLDENDDVAQDGDILDDTSHTSAEEEEEGEDDEFFDVLDVLDGRGLPDLGDDQDAAKSDGASLEKSRDPSLKNDNSVNKGGSDVDADMVEAEEDSDEEDEDSGEEDAGLDVSGSDEDEPDLSALDNLGSFVSGLETGAKRKAADEDEDNAEEVGVSQIKKKKRLLKDRTEASAESEFGARAGSSKLSLDDLLTPLASKPSTLSSLKKATKPLASSSNPKNQPLPAPLPTRTQERLDREAAYEQTKQEVDKWSETMKRIQEAEHLSFPLQAPRAVKVSNLELTSKFKPTTELESSIDRLLKSAKLNEEDINKTEDLLMKDLSVEEVAARRAELRKMRELAFRADAKAKRVSKIKSKAFHRIQKKERTKLLAKLDAAAGDAEDLEEERMKAEVERAKERATLKHKNTGKWAKAMKARGELDVDQRRDINEMLERGDRLRRRIQGVGSGSEDGDGDDGDSSGGDLVGEDGVMRIKASAFEELEKLRSGVGGEDDEGSDSDLKKKAKSVFEMKFMKDAAARQSQAVDRMIDDFRKEMGDLAENSDVDTEKDVGSPMPIERINGRMVFRPGPQSSNMLPPPPSAISETSTLRSHDSHVISPVLAVYDSPVSPPPPSFSVSSAAVNAEELNPWLALPEYTSSSSKVAKRKNELVVGKNVTRAQKSEGALQKQMKKGADERERETDDAVVEISPEDVLVLDSSERAADSTAVVIGAINGDSKKKTKEKKKSKKGKGKGARAEDGDDSGVNSEVEEQEAALTKGKKVKAFEQRELVARAFAGDNVVRQFEEAKRKEMEADAPREVDTTLAGWGSWGGTGTKKAAPKAHLIKKVAGIDPKSRADYGKAHVIISERRDKKAAKYAVRDLPHPYTSKAQFEARMDTPLGVEWNTRLGFQRGTLPRVVKKMGTIIDPLEKL